MANQHTPTWSRTPYAAQFPQQAPQAPVAATVAVSSKAIDNAAVAIYEAAVARGERIKIRDAYAIARAQQP